MAKKGLSVRILPMKSFDELREESSPDFLYHYTSLGSALKIMESKSVWASEIRYLNDAEEFKYAADKVRSLLNLEVEKATSNSLKRLIPLFGSVLDDVFGEAKSPGTCIFSLSEEGDLLSQWRGYCPPEGGIAMGLKATALKQLLAASNSPPLCLLRCIYDDVHHEALLKPVLDSLISELDERVIKAESQEAHDKAIIRAAFIFTVRFVWIASIIKNGAFKEEKEWRIVSRCSDEHLKFRAGRSMLIPYYPLSLESDSVSFPISKLIVGPSPHQKLSQNSLTGYLKQQGWDCECSASKVPFRVL
jgi:Protein of unknown function (DUF2971)